MLLGHAPSFVTQSQKRIRQWGQMALAMLAGALFLLFAMSFLEDIQTDSGGQTPAELFEDTRF
jgi:hypothetical protein